MAATHRRAAGTGVMLALLVAFASPAHAAFPGQNGKLAFHQCPFRCGITTIDQSGATQVTVGGVFGPIGVAGDRQRRAPDLVRRRAVDRVPAQRAPCEQPARARTRSRSCATTARNGARSPTSAPATLTSISWSPDGDELAYTRTGAAGHLDRQSRGPAGAARDLPHLPGRLRREPVDLHLRPQEVAWSPSGSQIAFSYAKGETTKGIGLLPPGAHGAEDLVAVTTLPWAKPGGGCCNRSTHGEATWSPDGTRLAFVHGELDALINEGTSRIETIDPDGTDPAVVRDYPSGIPGEAGFTSEPVWSPDGDWIIWKLTNGTTAKWEGAHPDGSGRDDIPIVGGQVDWQPCSTGLPVAVSGLGASAPALRVTSRTPRSPRATAATRSPPSRSRERAARSRSARRRGWASASGRDRPCSARTCIGRGGTVEFDAGETTATTRGGGRRRHGRRGRRDVRRGPVRAGQRDDLATGRRPARSPTTIRRRP